MNIFDDIFAVEEDKRDTGATVVDMEIVGVKAGNRKDDLLC